MFIEGKDLSQIYDNRQFQKQADFYGIDDIIVSYVPHTPASMLLYAPICKFDPLTAKRIWLILNILFLLGTVLLLKRIFDLSLILCSIVYLGLIIPVANNFLYGQPYIFLAFGICIVLYLWKYNKDLLSGLILGIVSSIKPFPAILLIPALYNRRQKIIVGFILGFLIFQIPILLLSPEIYAPYFNLVLPASIEGNIQNPYDTQFGTIAVFLRNAFLSDPFRNPLPIYESPFLFYFSKALLSLFFILIFIAIWSQLKSKEKHHDEKAIAIFMIPALMMAPFLSTYQYVLLLPSLIYLVKKYGCLYLVFIGEVALFSILKHFQIPYSELTFMILITMYILSKENPPIFRLGRNYILAYLLILVLPSAYAFEKTTHPEVSLFQDKAEPVTSMDIKGFPSELRSFGSNIYFTEISDGNYHLNLNGKDLGFKGYDIFNPCILPMDDYLLLGCQMIDKGRSQIVLFAEKEGNWSVIWKKNVTNVDDLEIARWLGNPFDGVALVWIDTDNSELTIFWPFSSRELLHETVEGIRGIRWNDANRELFMLSKRNDSAAFGIDLFAFMIVQNVSSTRPYLTYKIEAIPYLQVSIFDFDISPDGNYYAYSSNIDQEYGDIFIQKRGDETASIITNIQENDYSPSFVTFIDEDGKYHSNIYFISERGGGLNDGRIYRIDLASVD